MPRPNATIQTNTTVVLGKDQKVLTQINITDPKMTVIFTVKPSEDLPLVLMLSAGSPPNGTNVVNITTVDSTGNCHCCMIFRHRI